MNIVKFKYIYFYPIIHCTLNFFYFFTIIIIIIVIIISFHFFFFNFQFISVDETSGEITVRAKLDHELESVYDFVVVPISGIEKSMHVYIHVNDENDNAPEFPVSSISVRFM